MKRSQIEWSRPASKDLINIIDYITHDSIDAAIQIFDEIKSKCNTLEQSSQRGRVIPELKEHGIFCYRELIIKPWRIIYRITNNIIFILAVIDSRRNIDDILMDRFLE